jgi:hypothetical protein
MLKIMTYSQDPLTRIAGRSFVRSIAAAHPRDKSFSIQTTDTGSL